MDDPGQYLRAREAEAMCHHVWIFEARTLSTQPVRRRSGVCGVYRMEPRCREPGTSTCELRAGGGTWDKARADCAGTWQAHPAPSGCPANDAAYLSAPFRLLSLGFKSRMGPSVHS